MKWMVLKYKMLRDFTLEKNCFHSQENFFDQLYVFPLMVEARLQTYISKPFKNI